MKKIYFYVLILSGIFFSCNNENDLSIDNHNSIQTLISNEGGILKFKDQTTFNTILDSLDKMSSNDKILFLTQYNVKTQNIIFNDAENELTNIVNNSSNKDEFDLQYKVYKEKYNDIFMFNSDSLFISPYSKLTDKRLAAIVNAKGEYMIGDNVFKANSFECFDEYEKLTKSAQMLEQTNGLQRAQSTSSSVNYAWSEQSKRRVYMTLRSTQSGTVSNFPYEIIGPVTIYADLEAWKWTWFGFVRYSTIFYVEFSVNKYFIYAGIPGPINTVYPANTNISMEGEGSGITLLLGITTFTPGTMYDPGVTIRGNAKVWTRGLDESVAGKTSIKIN